MKTFLAISLIAASIAVIPSADATNSVCQASACAGEGSYSYGSGCSDGGMGNYVYAYNNDGSSFTLVTLQTYCNGSPGAYSTSGIGLGVYSFGTAGQHYMNAGWAGYNFGGNTGCSILVFTSDAGYQVLPCAAGNPPGVPAVLP